MNAAVAVFARAPEPGRVKTRLIPRLGAEGACAVHQRLVDHTLRVVAATDLPAWLYAAGDISLLRGCADRHGLGLVAQCDGGLGRRMAAALAELHGHGYERVIVVGSDCPVLDSGYLEQAGAWLRDRNFVLGPAEDGGYVLLGSACPAAWSPQVLDGVRFGGPHARSDTRAVLEAFGPVACLEPLWDLDDPDDWVRARHLDLLNQPWTDQSPS